MINKEELYKAAQAAAGFSYSPYSRFRVGAAVLTGDGEIFTGCNVENSSFPVGICAERAAISKAVSEGKTRFTAIAIAAESGGRQRSASPCGMCRQFIMEFGSDIEVIFLSSKGKLVSEKISSLLPWGFEL